MKFIRYTALLSICIASSMNAMNGLNAELAAAQEALRVAQAAQLKEKKMFDQCSTECSVMLTPKEKATINAAALVKSIEEKIAAQNS